MTGDFFRSVLPENEDEADRRLVGRRRAQALMTPIGWLK
jgi:hypothetical protein